MKLSSITLPLATPISDAKVFTGRQKPMTEVAFLFAEITTEDGHEGVGFSYSKRAGGPGQFAHAGDGAVRQLLRPAVYFGCVGIFTYLFRGEVVERTLHYYFLSPIRRGVMVAGKYAAGLITAAFFFCGSIILSFTGMYAHYAGHEIRAYVVDGPGLGHLLAYIGITALACMAYGALFLWLGIRYKNPVIPAVILLFWESVNIFLPTWLKKVSILYYLRSLAPVDPGFYGPGALFGGVADPASAPVAILSLLAITIGLLTLAAKDLRTAEISYSSD